MNKTQEVINWKKCVELANNKEEIALEMLSLFSQELPVMHEEILKAYQEKDYKQMRNLLHKLNGACCYLSAPRLKQIVEQLEEQLKKPELDRLQSWINEFNDEVPAVLTDLKRFT